MSPVQQSRAISIHSSVRGPRSANGTSSASNSSCSQPAPTPRRRRPSLATSIEAACFANITGERSGSTSTAVPSVARSVTEAASARAIIASTYGASEGQVALPSAAKG